MTSSRLKARVERTLDTALTWFTQNSPKINPSKTKLLLFKTRSRKTQDFTIRLSGHTLAGVTKAKVLGVILDPALTWEYHVSMVVQRCNHVLVGISVVRCQRVRPCSRGGGRLASPSCDVTADPSRVGSDGGRARRGGECGPEAGAGRVCFLYRNTRTTRAPGVL